MADEDEIDVLGDFSFNSCFAQNNQGIPSCSNREDTVHPQWLLDSTATNWYDIQNRKSNRESQSKTKNTSSNSSSDRDNSDHYSTWTSDERDILEREMEKYGRNVIKISQTLKTKTEAEIQALIEAEYGINLDTPTFGLENEGLEGIPSVVHEEIVMDVPNIMKSKSPNSRKHVRKKRYNYKSKNSLLKSNVLKNPKTDTLDVDPKEIFYEDDLIIGSTESIGSDMDLTDIVSKNVEKFQKAKVGRKMGNHRRKLSGSEKAKQRNKCNDLMKSPLGRQRKDSNLSEDSMRSPRMQIVLGSGQALPVSEGEQVIKIEKKKESDSESDIDVDVDSDNDNDGAKIKTTNELTVSKFVDEAPVAEPLAKFQPMPKRQKKIKLAGEGGYTIMHTAAGDLLRVGAEPRRVPRPSPRPSPRRPAPEPLLPCRRYNADRPAPFQVRIHVSALISMDAHAHTSRAEVMGLVGAAADARAAAPGPPTLTAVAYRPAAASSELTHCDMDPVSQAAAAAALAAGGGAACGWHHSHPAFPAAPSRRDLRTQRRLQRALERRAPFLALITSQHWPVGRTASHYRCIRVEEEEGDEDNPVGYQLSVKLVPDLTTENLPAYLDEVVSILCCETDRSQYMVDMANDICPQAKISYLEKCISSISHHMRSAGYEDDDPVVKQLIQGIRDIFR